jgi:hypothetical protein
LRYAFWDAVLGGAHLGEAHLAALNRKMITVLENGQLTQGGVDRRTMIMRHLYGDPAFRMHVPDTPRVRPACAKAEDDRVTVQGPESWYIMQIRVPEDWKLWAERPLYVLRGPGIYIRAHWCGEEYDIEEIYTDVAYTTRRKIEQIEQARPLPEPLGWRGKYFVDEHADGSRTYRWRVRMADFDQTTGTIRATVETIDYRIK